MFISKRDTVTNIKFQICIAAELVNVNARNFVYVNFNIFFFYRNFNKIIS